MLSQEISRCPRRSSVPPAVHWFFQPSIGACSRPLVFSAVHWFLQPSIGFFSRPLVLSAVHWFFQPSVGFSSRPLVFPAVRWFFQPSIGACSRPLVFPAVHWLLQPSIGFSSRPLVLSAAHWFFQPSVGFSSRPSALAAVRWFFQPSIGACSRPLVFPAVHWRLQPSVGFSSRPSALAAVRWFFQPPLAFSAVHWFFQLSIGACSRPLVFPAVHRRFQVVRFPVSEWVVGCANGRFGERMGGSVSEWVVPEARRFFPSVDYYPSVGEIIASSSSNAPFAKPKIEAGGSLAGTGAARQKFGHGIERCRAALGRPRSGRGSRARLRARLSRRGEAPSKPVVPHARSAAAKRAESLALLSLNGVRYADESRERKRRGREEASGDETLAHVGRPRELQ